MIVTPFIKEIYHLGFNVVDPDDEPEVRENARWNASQGVAWACVGNNDLIEGVGGFWYKGDGMYQSWLWISCKMQERKVALCRAVKKVMSEFIARCNPKRLLANVDRSWMAAHRFAKHLGYKRYAAMIYDDLECEDQIMYSMEIQ